MLPIVSHSEPKYINLDKTQIFTHVNDNYDARDISNQ